MACIRIKRGFCEVNKWYAFVEKLGDIKDNRFSRDNRISRAITIRCHSRVNRIGKKVSTRLPRVPIR
jgi:hypothetical protein